MNDDQLDIELRQLFEAEARSIDPKAPGATALLESITSEVMVFDLVESDLISLPEPTPEPSRGRILLVAAVILLALLGIGRWLLPFSDEAPVISDETFDFDDFDDFDVNGAAEIVPDGFIEGPPSPVVLIDHSGLDPADISFCVPSTGGFDPAPRVTEGSGVLAVVNGTRGQGFPSFADGPTRLVVSVVDAVSSSTCELQSGGGGVGLGVSFDESWSPGPVAVALVATGNSVEPGLIWGRLADDVSEIRLRAASAEQQSFQRVGEGWFRLDFEANSDLGVEVMLDDGTIIDTHPDLLIETAEVERCRNEACVSDWFDLLQEEALEAGAIRQAAFLDSGVLSQAEYDFAEEAFGTCVSEFLEPGPFGSTILEAGTADADAAQACYDQEIRFLERARLQQNGIAEFEELDRGNESAIAQVDPLINEARSLFGGGLSREELEQFWDGFPYPAGEREARIDQYLTDFSWMREGIVVEANLFEEVPGSGVFTPVVVAQSVRVRSLTAAFVLGTVGDEVVIRRLPEADAESFVTFDPDERTVTASAAPNQGRVAAFNDAEELEQISVTEGVSTTFALPGDFRYESMVTVVVSAPEEPIIDTVVLSSDFE